MRAALAALLALAVLLGAAATHVHVGVRGGEECALCAGRQAEVARSETPEVAPRVFDAGEVPAAGGLAPPVGAPLGAVPGQSPPGVA